MTLSKVHCMLYVCNQFSCVLECLFLKYELLLREFVEYTLQLQILSTNHIDAIALLADDAYKHSHSLMSARRANSNERDHPFHSTAVFRSIELLDEIKF